VDQVWFKARDGGPSAPTELFGARPATRAWHPIAAIDPAPCTEQMGVSGAWYQRLPHFRIEFTPSAGAELQSEYFVARNDAIAAFEALRAIQDVIAPHLLVSEIRTVAADDFWLSMNYERDSVAFHFTMKPDWPAVRDVLPHIEAALAPFAPRPHWGKLFTMDGADIRARYPRLADFRALTQRLDPGGKFRNGFVADILAGSTGPEGRPS
jgi:xylitol oxidase